MKQLAILFLFVCLVGCDKYSDVDWEAQHRLDLAVRVHKLEDAVEQIQAERNILPDSKESTTFVSVAALRATADEVFEPFFSKWVAKAREWDEKHPVWVTEPKR